ncbi:hypothetical protein PHYBOEH_000173 [Phytophthora boehmeriae]|uniref:Uncharacterized protein n=1 Tax=Phytophthora boehmeriae TaxID=109152 RepID=A0A8T1WUH0_9STRA|nr:hypothetical protein PHYBOEH_000173 [Phytophthora boehmeriae]
MNSVRLNAAWNNDELLHLIEAWEQVVEVPRDRLVLSSAERMALHDRFVALSDSSRRTLSSVTRQHHRLCTSYRLVVETNAQSEVDGTPRWFDLPTTQQNDLRKLHGKKERGMTALTPELFHLLERICARDAKPATAPLNLKAKTLGPGRPKKAVKAPKKIKALKTPKTPKKSGVSSTDAVNESPRYTWTQQDWLLFVDAWKEAVDEFVDYGNDQREKIKLPNWLIRQRFVALGGSNEVSVGSITAKKRCVVNAYQFVRDCVAGMQALDGSDWFKLTFNERFRLQRKLIGPKSSQRLGCEIGLSTYNKIAAIIEKEEVLATVTGHKRKRSHKHARKASVSSDSSLDASSTRSPSSLSSDEDMSGSEEAPPRLSAPPPTDFVDEELSNVDERVVEALLDAQNARFEQLMHDLREERMEERKQNQCMLLEILHQRTPPEDPQQNVKYMETLVSKQQEQLMDLFVQMQKERHQEREDFHAMLRQLVSQARS